MHGHGGRHGHARRGDLAGQRVERRDVGVDQVHPGGTVAVTAMSDQGRLAHLGVEHCRMTRVRTRYDRSSKFVLIN